MEKTYKRDTQIVHTVLGSTTKPVEFSVGQFVKAKNFSGEWIVLQMLGDDKYIIGREGVTQEVESKNLTLI